MFALWCWTIRAQTPIFRSGIEYVRIEAVVTSRQGVPVVDLKASDFEVRESDQLQQIIDFQFVDVSATVPVRTGESFVPHEVASNVIAPQARLFVLVIDDLHVIPQDLVAVQKTAFDFLKALSEHDVVAVVFPGRPDLSQDFTTDRSKLATAVERSRDALGFATGPVPIEPNSAEAIQRRHFASTLLTGLQNMTSILANSVFSRRAVVLIGGGVDLNFADPGDREIAQEYQATVDAAARADVRIYTMDLTCPANFGPAEA